MTKQFYIATKKDREAQANAISEALKNQGWRRTYTWTAQEPGAEDQHSKIAQDELSAVRDADVLIVLLPGGFGTHVEIGAALAWNKPVILHAPNHKILKDPYPCVFHYHPNVRIFVSEEVDVDAILKAIA